MQAAIRSPLPLTDMNGPGIVKAGRISLALAVYVPSLSPAALLFFNPVIWHRPKNIFVIKKP